MRSRNASVRASSVWLHTWASWWLRPCEALFRVHHDSFGVRTRRLVQAIGKVIVKLSIAVVLFV
jgi:hypothetical protein